MAVFNEPAQWDHALGNNADTSTLPDDAAATAGIASLQKLFQLINATPLEAGGIAPDREDVNALFKYLGDQIFYTQNGGIPSYNADYDYVAGRVVLYNDNLYKCIQANGASSTVVAPDSDTAYWQRLDNFVRSVNGVNADASGNVSTLPDYAAGVTISSVPYIAPSNGLISVKTTRRTYDHATIIGFNGVAVMGDQAKAYSELRQNALINKGQVVTTVIDVYSNTLTFDGTTLELTFYPLKVVG